MTQLSAKFLQSYPWVTQDGPLLIYDFLIFETVCY